MDYSFYYFFETILQTLLKSIKLTSSSSLNLILNFSSRLTINIKCLKESVPSEVPGIAFLSGGQTEKKATKNLNQINVKNETNFIMTYSYGRALQQGALKFWSKDLKNIKGTQEVFNHRAKMCSLASKGKWSEEVDKI